MQAGKLRTTFAFALRRRVNPTENLSSQRMVLIDDVLTMDATASEATRVLHSTGAEVIVAVLAQACSPSRISPTSPIVGLWRP